MTGPHILQRISGFPISALSLRRAFCNINNRNFARIVGRGRCGLRFQLSVFQISALPSGYVKEHASGHCQTLQNRHSFPAFRLSGFSVGCSPISAFQQFRISAFFCMSRYSVTKTRFFCPPGHFFSKKTQNRQGGVALRTLRTGKPPPGRFEFRPPFRRSRSNLAAERRLSSRLWTIEHATGRTAGFWLISAFSFPNFCFAPSHPVSAFPQTPPSLPAPNGFTMLFNQNGHTHQLALPACCQPITSSIR